MAIKWMKDISTIRRALTEADPSDRLIAVNSLEMLGTRDALKVLEEFYPNSVNLEKFFVQRAVTCIKQFIETGEHSLEIRKSLAKLERLSQVEESLGKPKAASDGSDREWKGEFSLDDVAESLPRRPESKPKTVIEPPKPEKKTVKPEVVALPPEPEPVEELEPMTSSLEAVSEEGESSYDSSEQLLMEEAAQSAMGAEYDYDSYTEPVQDLSDGYDDLLPDLGTSESYDDLLPPMISESSAEQEYDDLLPPLADSGDVDEYEDLLPPMISSQDSGAPGLMSLDDDYESLLPPVGDVVVDDYDDLLPPTRSSSQDSSTTLPASLDEFEDLLPPLKADDEDYNDLLPPLKKG